MRILLITNRYPAGPEDPASPFVPHFARALVNAGVSVDVLTPDYGYSSDVDRDLQVHRFTTGASVPVGSWNYLSPFAWLKLERFLASGLARGRQLCQSTSYDHILALWALPSGHFAQRLSREFNVPYSVWCLGSDIYTWAERPFFRTRIERVLNGAQCIFADGDDLCHRITNWLGVDAHFMPSFRPLGDVVHTTTPQPTDAPKYLYLGRLHRAKGVYELLEAFRIVRQALSSATLTFVGGGPALEELEERVTAAQIDDSVKLLGPVSDDVVVEQLIASDVVVIPSRSDSIPLVLTEAVQVNRPVIGSDVGDLGRTIREFGLGVVTQSIEPYALADVMRRIAKTPTVDQTGRQRLLKRMQPSAAVSTFQAVLAQCEKQDKPTHNSATPPRQTAYSE